MHRLGEFRAGKPEGLEPVMWSKPDKQGELKKKGMNFRVLKFR